MIEDRDDIDKIVDAFNSVKSVMKASNILPLMQDFQAIRSPTVKYWQQYLDMVLLHFIRAERGLAFALVFICSHAAMVCHL